MATENVKQTRTRWNGWRWRRIGWVLLVTGVALLPALFAYGNARFPLTNYNSTIDVEHPVVYYAHELRAGDTIVFSFTVTGGPVDFYLLDVGAYELFASNGRLPEGVAPEAFVTGLSGSVEVLFRVQETAVHYVVFRAACEESCDPTTLRASVEQTSGDLAAIPLSVAYSLAAFAAIAGTALLVRYRGR